MSLWDLLKGNKKDVFQQYAENMPPLQPIKEELPAIQLEGGPQAGQQAQITPNKGLTLTERLFGVQANPTDNIDPNTMNVTISNNPRVGGLFNDIASGARENFTTGFAAPNLFDDKTSDGRDKGFAYRLGEGLGTLGRIAESPLGRGLITAGIVGATGGNGLEALAYGGQAGALNQNLRSADNLYRQQLKDNYGYTAEQLNKTKGYINANTFNNLTKSQNSAMNIALRQQATQSMNKLRELQAEKLRIQNSNLPELEKAKLKKANAEAAHAEEMQLARINYYNNAVANPLGWGRLGLALDQFNYKKDQDKKEEEKEQKIIDSLGGGVTPAPQPKKGWAF